MSRSLNNRLVIEFATVRGPRSFVRLMRSYGARRLLRRIVPRKRIVYWTGSAAFCRAVYGCTCLVSIRSSSGSGQVVCIYRRFSSSPRSRLSHRSESSSGFELFPFLSRRHSARSGRTTAPY